MQLAQLRVQIVKLVRACPAREQLSVHPAGQIHMLLVLVTMPVPTAMPVRLLVPVRLRVLDVVRANSAARLEGAAPSASLEPLVEAVQLRVLPVQQVSIRQLLDSPHARHVALVNIAPVAQPLALLANQANTQTRQGWLVAVNVLKVRLLELLV